MAAEEEIDSTAELVKERWKKGDRHLQRARRDYWLNLAFYQGRQWVTWDRRTGTVRDLSPRQRESERVRVTVNKIEPRIDTLLGILTERQLTFEGDPTAADDQSISGSRLGEAILESARQQQNWETVRLETIANLLFGGTAAVALEWNKSGGEQLYVNEGNDKVVGTGEVQLVPLSIAEFTLEAGSRRAEDARHMVMALAMPPAQVKEKFSLKWDPSADATEQIAPVVSTGSDRKREDLTTVYVMYERPWGKNKGRRVAVVNGKTVAEDDWPYPFNELPVRVFRQGYLPMQWFGKTFVSAARQVQVIYNAARSNAAEHMKLAANNRLFVPAGSVDDISVLTDQAGEIVEFDPSFGEPRYVAPPGLPKAILDEVDRLEAELDDILHAHDVARGVAPGDRNSGLALSILAEKNNTPLGVMAHDQSEGWGHIGTLVLKMYADKVSESREAIIVTQNGIPQKWKWTGADLRGQTDIRVPIDSTAPHTRAQMLAQLQNIQQLSPVLFGQIDMQRMLRMLNLTSARELNNALNPDVAKAQRENDRMAAGEPQLPAKFDDHAKHIAELNAFRKTTAFEVLPDNVKEIFEAHAQAHERLSQEELMQQASLNAVQSGLGAMPQAHDPMGSAVPPPFSQQLSENQPLPPGPPQ